MFWIFDVIDGEHSGEAIGPFETEAEASAHATTTIAEWADWDIARIEVVQSKRYIAQ